jgi:ribosome-associated protein
MSVQNKKIPVKNLPIRLGQFLKLANIVQDGFEAKIRIQNGEVMVNNIVETRRGRQLKNLDKVTVDRTSWIVDIVE